MIHLGAMNKYLDACRRMRTSADSFGDEKREHKSFHTSK